MIVEGKYFDYDIRLNEPVGHFLIDHFVYYKSKGKDDKFIEYAFQHDLKQILINRILDKETSKRILKDKMKVYDWRPLELDYAHDLVINLNVLYYYYAEVAKDYFQYAMKNVDDYRRVMGSKYPKDFEAVNLSSLIQSYRDDLMSKRNLFGSSTPITLRGHDKIATHVKSLVCSPKDFVMHHDIHQRGLTSYFLRNNITYEDLCFREGVNFVRTISSIDHEAYALYNLGNVLGSPEPTDLVQDLYNKLYPTDKNYVDINPSITLEDVLRGLSRGEDFRDFVAADSVIHERVTELVSEAFSLDESDVRLLDVTGYKTEEVSSALGEAEPTKERTAALEALNNATQALELSDGEQIGFDDEFPF